MKSSSSCSLSIYLDIIHVEWRSTSTLSELNEVLLATAVYSTLALLSISNIKRFINSRDEKGVAE